MTLDDQIREALSLLTPKEEDRGECRERIFDALNVINIEVANREHPRTYVSKEAKLTLEQFCAALKRARDIRNKLPPMMNMVSFSSLDLDGYIATCEEYLAVPSGPPRRQAFRQRAAVIEARDLLMYYGKRPTTTRLGAWHKLSAILFGDKRADLYHHCAAFKKGGIRP